MTALKPARKLLFRFSYYGTGTGRRRESRDGRVD